MAALVSLPLLLGCGAASPPYPMMTYSSPGVDLSRFEGRWYDPEGNLIVVFSDRPESRYSILFEGFHLQPRSAGAGRQNKDQLHFSWTISGQPMPVTLTLVGEDEAALDSVPPEGPSGDCCVCGRLFGLTLVRNPSPLWLLKLQTEGVKEFARQARDSAFDQLARVL